MQWRSGLPPGLESRLSWRKYAGLSVGLVGRHDLIFFKLFAAADDRGPDSVHFKDLIALHPTDLELEAAAAWIRTQEANPEFSLIVAEVIRHARTR